jgi:hypothetical protein
MVDWNHSVVIYSLLQRPTILGEWDAVLASTTRVYVGFGWDRGATGRVEGYPDRTQTAQLQDELEYLAPGRQDAAVLARKAFDLAVKKVEREPPPVSKKDHHVPLG